MAEKRKLLNEIDKCYKKIEEGFEIFDDIMAKMAEANSDNQREKFQDDLKKEIKKLQRLRDQIKGWQNSSEIKDKDSLSKFRKLIEQRMEIFKDVERENKTKPHSKQGLSAEDKLDPREKEKCETIEWLNGQIRRIQDEIDRTESKLETLSSMADTNRKRGKKDDGKKNEKEKVEELRKHLERVKFHLLNLEVCMRMINNEKLEIKDVNGKLKEPLEMYIDALDPENDDDPESLDPEDIYEELNFGTYLSQLGGITAASVDEEKGLNDNGCSISPQISLKDKQLNVSSPTVAATTPETDVFLFNGTATAPSTPVTTITTNLAEKVPFSAVPSSSNSNKPKHNTTSKSFAWVTAAADLQAPPRGRPRTPNDLDELQRVELDAAEVPGAAADDVASVTGSRKAPSIASPPRTPCTSKSPKSPRKVKMDEPPPMEEEDVEIASKDEEEEQRQESFEERMREREEEEEGRWKRLNHMIEQQLESQQPKSREPQETIIPPWLGASPLGMIALNDDLNNHLQMLDATLTRCPVQMDSEKTRSYLPKMPCQTPPYYPQTPLPNADSLEYYLRLSVEALFFTFYYMEGSRAQLLAAKALKKLSWRFHTKYLMWFQRHEEPKQITDDFEQGTYVYFDFEKWVQRKKEQFTFEYKYLEDKDFE
uniref:CCR4-NOT transcription complex subunit 3 n=1 Tax=Globodera rostochiensis TaxID=31243 RepID=A0A914HT59_GLORO